MRVLRITFVALFCAIPMLLTAAPAGAALKGPCEASGTLNGKTYNPKTVNKVVIPHSGDVAWKGSIPGSGERAIAGSVHLKLPWPIPEQDLGAWGKKSSRYANNGVYHYDLPTVLEGIDFPLSGVHTEPGKVCAGAVVIRLEGGGVSNPGVIGSFVVLVLSGIGLWVAFKPKVV